MPFKPPPLSYTSKCFNCNTDFTFWKGRFRHHCRGCGNNFCSDCVQNNCALPHIGINEDVRTCDTCYKKYKIKGNADNDFESERSIANSFENITLNDDFEEIEAENAQCQTKEESSAEECQLAIALSLSRIEEQFYKYATSDDNTIMSEEEEIRYVLKLSELEEKAKHISSRLQAPVTQKMSEDEELSLALAISKIENEEAKSSKVETPIPSRQVHCPICFEERLEYALVDCGHVVCGDCKPKLKECPICRAGIRGAFRVYITD